MLSVLAAATALRACPSCSLCTGWQSQTSRLSSVLGRVHLERCLLPRHPCMALWQSSGSRCVAQHGAWLTWHVHVDWRHHASWACCMQWLFGGFARLSAMSHTQRESRLALVASFSGMLGVDSSGCVACLTSVLTVLPVNCPSCAERALQQALCILWPRGCAAGRSEPSQRELCYAMLRHWFRRVESSKAVTLLLPKVTAWLYVRIVVSSRQQPFFT